MSVSTTPSATPPGGSNAAPIWVAAVEAIDLLLYGDPEAYPCVIATLDRSRPKYVIYGYVWDVDGKHFSDYARPVADYIRTRYRVETTVPGYEIWQRSRC